MWVLVLIYFSILSVKPSFSSQFSEQMPSSRAELIKLSQTKAWLNLLHYEKTLFGGYRGEVEGEAFYLSKDGKYDPAAELEENIRIFSDQSMSQVQFGPIKQPLLCAFPARVILLEKMLSTRFQKTPCLDYEQWFRGLAAETVSLVYSASYPKNPASMFGHTLLKIDSHKSAGNLLGYGANYSASIPVGESKVKFAILGLLGGYSGRFEFSPYYQKVNEYAVSENRDLWEYKLPLSPDEVHFLIAHLWELYGVDRFQYYFLNRNCSYQLLKVIDAVKPEWRLARGFWFYAMPSETLKRLPHLARTSEAITRRPSLRNSMLTRFQLLSQVQINKVLDAYDTRAESNLDFNLFEYEALIALTKYRLEQSDGDTRVKRYLNSILLGRSKLGPGAPQNSQTGDFEDHPDRSHGPMRTSVRRAFGSTAQDLFWLKYTFFSHDLLNRTAGFRPFTEVQVLGLEARVGQENKPVQISEVTAIRMKSYADFNQIDRETSWQMSLGWNESSYQASGGYGLSTYLFSPDQIAFFLPAFDLGKLAWTGSQKQLWVGWDAGIVMRSRKKIPLSLELRSEFRSSGEKPSLRQSLGVASDISPLIDLRLRLSHSQAQKSVGSLELGFMY